MTSKSKEINSIKAAEGVEFADDSESLPEEEFEGPIKLRVTMFMDERLINKIKEEAAARGMKYQTLIHQTLFESFLDPNCKAATQAEVEEIRTRLRGIEQKLYNQSR